jgi:hypothetical protein
MSKSSATPKQPYSVYTVMLITSAILMLFACIFMAVEYSRW